MFEDVVYREERMAGYERSLIGTCLAFAAEMDKAAHILPTDFANPSHHRIWELILGLYHNNQLSARAVIEGLRMKDQLSDLGMEFGSRLGEQYLSECLTYAAQASTRNFADMVLDASTKRSIREQAALMAVDSGSEVMSDEILDKYSQKLMDLRRSAGHQGLPISNILDMFELQTGQRLSGGFTPALVPHQEDIRDILDFYEDTDFVVIGARPGEGKSSYLRFEAFREAQELKRTVIINMENNEVEYARYMIAMKTRINSKRLRNPSLLTADELNDVKTAILYLKSLPLYVITMGAPSVTDITRVMRQEVLNGARSFWVDYAQLIRNGEKNTVDDITKTSTMLRGFALSNHVPIILASQFSREITHRGENADPDLADLRGSGSLEQDPTHVIALRHAWANPTRQDLDVFPENRGQEVVCAIALKAFILKSRNSGIGTTNEFKWVKSTNNFVTLTRH
jgi:replicative DNA helicase